MGTPTLGCTVVKEMGIEVMQSLQPGCDLLGRLCDALIVRNPTFPLGACVTREAAPTLIKVSADCPQCQ